MTPTYETIFGSDLRVGDIVKVWWSPKRDTIVSLEPYTGPLLHIFEDGAQIAGFAVGPGMTIDNGDLFERLVLKGETP